MTSGKSREECSSRLTVNHVGHRGAGKRSRTVLTAVEWSQEKEKRKANCGRKGRRGGGLQVRVTGFTNS